MKKLLFLVWAIMAMQTAWAQKPAARRLELLFLGDNGHHKPFDRYPALQSAIGVKGMNITYTESLKDLNEGYLNKFDALIIFARFFWYCFLGTVSADVFLVLFQSTP